MNHKQCLLLGFLAILLVFSTLTTSNAETSGLKTPNSFTEAVSLYYQGDFKAALQNLQQYVVQNPNDNVARHNLVRLLEEAGQINDALTQLQYLIDQKSANPDDQLLFLKLAYLAGMPDLVITNAGAEGLKPEKEFWLGLALADQGKNYEAIQALERYLADQPFNPFAYYMAGQLYQENNNFEKAHTYYLRALSQEPNFTIIYYPLALTYLAAEKYQKAYNLLLNAAAISPGNQMIAATLQQLTSTHPELVKQEQAIKEKNRQIANPPQVAPILAGREKIPEIRIGLVSKIKQLYLKTGGAFLLTDRDNDNSTPVSVITGDTPTVLEIEANNGLIKISDQTGAVLYNNAQDITLSYQDPAVTTILFDVAYGTGMFWAGRDNRIYRGQIQLLAKKEGLTVINRLNIEEYLYSVVASEMSPSWPEAALEAQAIAARTYAFANMGQFESLGFDLWGTVISQAYDGVSAETASTRAAVDNSRGKIITYNGKPIAAFFTGNSGGYSENSQDIWNFSLPYLQAVPDPLLPPRVSPLPPDDLVQWLSDRPDTYSSNPKYSSRSSYRWVAWISRAELERRLNLETKLGHITAITTMGRGFTGVVKQIFVTGTSGESIIKSDEIRDKLGGLRSNLFVVEPKLGADGLPEYFIFTGAGWGHGVGMCQSGAAGMAAAGISCTDILRHYYPGTIMETKY